MTVWNCHSCNFRSFKFPLQKLNGVSKLMKKCVGLLALAFLISLTAAAQDSKPKKKKDPKSIIYYALGSHRIFYTRSTIHIKRGGPVPLNFTLYNVKGRDEGGLKWDTAPQFSYTGGIYFVKKKWGLEYQYDHIKYFVKKNQVVRIKGSIQDRHLDRDTTLSPDFFQMEHSDGGNYCMFNFVKWFPLAAAKDNKIALTLIAKGGLGFGNPKTNTTITGEHRDNYYHLSGFIAGLESGLKVNIGKVFYITGSFKGTYANYDDFLISNGRGKQQWFSAQLIYLVGAQLPLH